MTEEERTIAQKEAVASMKAAQANMTKALDRINTLEKALMDCANNLENAAKLLPEHYPYRSEKTYKSKYLELANEARKVL